VAERPRVRRARGRMTMGDIATIGVDGAGVTIELGLGNLNGSVSWFQGDACEASECWSGE
jgi:hypothetical protein